MINATVTVSDAGAIAGIVGRVARSLADGTRALRELETRQMDRVQFAHALDNWGGAPLWRESEPLSAFTLDQRARRQEYYKNHPSPRASLGSRLVWTGGIALSTIKFTEVRDDEAVIDTRRNYTGPITETDDPAEDIAATDHGAALWDFRGIDEAVESDTWPRHAGRAVRAAAGGVAT